MNINEFLDRDVEIQLKDGKDMLSSPYFDYRVGCDICQNGPATGLETNIQEIVKDNKFLLNDLKIMYHDWYNQVDIKEMYVCKERGFFSDLQTLWENFNDGLVATRHYIFGKDSIRKSNCCLTSIFDEENVDEVLVCCHCLAYIKLLRPEWNFDHFKELDPLLAFWSNVVDIYLDDIESAEKEYLVDFCKTII